MLRVSREAVAVAMRVHPRVPARYAVAFDNGLCLVLTDGRVDLDALAASAADSDLLILVNPNSPTGLHVPREQLLQLLDGVPRTTRVWIDETYVEYVGAEQSLGPLFSQLFSREGALQEIAHVGG